MNNDKAREKQSQNKLNKQIDDGQSKLVKDETSFLKIFRVFLKYWDFLSSRDKSSIFLDDPVPFISVYWFLVDPVPFITVF